MTRINLSPTTKRGCPSRWWSLSASKGSIYTLVMLFGWIAVGVASWPLQAQVEEERARLRTRTSALHADIETIEREVGEEDLQARFNLYEGLVAATETLQELRRTPVPMFGELARILSSGEMPTIDERKQAGVEALDPQARLDPNWDAESVWLVSMIEERPGVFTITGGARDPDDISELVKRLRASIYFARISHPEFELESLDRRSPYLFEFTAEVEPEPTLKSAA